MTNLNIPTVADVASSIDHAILAPNLTKEKFHSELALAKKLNLFSVCVRPCDVEEAVAFLSDSNVKVGTVVGFPHGSSTTSVKSVEALEAIDNGAKEIDIVMNISHVLNGEAYKSAEEIGIIVNVARSMPGLEKIKVIFENAYLTAEQIKEVSIAMQNAGVDFTKTSTGTASSGAKLEDVKVMVEFKGGMEVKASGGIRTINDYLAFRAAGVTRFGTSNSEVILTDLEKMHNGTFEAATIGGEY